MTHVGPGSTAVRSMSELLHRIKVFVFRLDGQEPDYLLRKPDQGLEAMWGPIQGPLGFDEKLESAIKKRVREETGMPPPGKLIDLQLPLRWSLGDEEIVEWCFGFESMGRPDPDRFGKYCADFRWLGFADAYPSLEFEADRAAIMRLHTLLRAA
jgi:hypothetical protein